VSTGLDEEKSDTFRFLKSLPLALKNLLFTSNKKLGAAGKLLFERNKFFLPKNILFKML
jgi:hypothetical protein